MRFFISPLDIPDDQGFSKDVDIFGRAEIGKGLTNLVSRVEDPLVIAIDGQWGSGKTTFLKMWAGSLRGEGYPVVYFDAFAHDYIGDAYIALAGETISLLKSQKRSSTATGKRFVNKALGVGRVLLRSSLKVGVKTATMGVLTAADLEEVADAASGELADRTDEYIGEIITKQKEQKQTIDSFKDALSEIPSALAANGEGGFKPLIFIIDELDRCRPDFALELLERMKHIFSVPNVHFVLGVHMGQLENSVAAAYGSRIDAALYLQKFVHLAIPLVEGKSYVSNRATTKYVKYLLKAHDFAPQDRETAQYCGDFVRFVSDHRDLSLRTIERIFSVLALTLAYTPHQYFRPPPIVAGLCILKVLSPAHFIAAKRGTLRYSEIEQILCLNERDESERHAEWASRWWRYALDPDADQALIDQMASGTFRYSLDDRLELVPDIANDMIDRLSART